MGHSVNVAQLSRSLTQFPDADILSNLATKLAGVLPHGVEFRDDCWDIFSWKRYRGNSKYQNIDFGTYQNSELRILVKIYVLHKRLTKNIGGNTAINYVRSIKALDEVMWLRSDPLLTNADFERAEHRLIENSTAPSRLCGFLADFGRWLTMEVNLPISYRPKAYVNHIHGQRGTDEGREAKLIPSSVIHDMLAANNRDDLSTKDRFFLSAFTLMVATGFRVNELATLPKNCLLYDDGVVGILYFAEKFGRLGKRYFAVDMVPAVETAIAHIIEITEPGRRAVQERRQQISTDWSQILCDESATRYFVGKYAHNWTANLRHKIINPDGAWLEKEKRYVDVIGLVAETGSKSATARKLGITRNGLDGLLAAQVSTRRGLRPNLIDSRREKARTSWDTDSRVISVLKFINESGVTVCRQKRAWVRDVISNAQELQVCGQIFPCPEPELELERKYIRKINPVVIDRDGTTLLEPEDALFVIPRYLFSETRPTRDEDYRLITDKAFSRWLLGESRSLSTGNHEDSCFSRLGIIDPRTGEIVKFVSHDVRHWLHTTYAEGHMPDEMIALIFGRKASSNHVYNQTSSKVRRDNLADAVRQGKVYSNLTETYNRLAKYSREEAEQYLLARTLMVNAMPQGACTLSWGMQSCEHYLSCFACESGVCEHYTIDISDPAQRCEIERLLREVGATLDYMFEESPQYEHLSLIKKNLTTLLNNTKRRKNG